MSITSPKMITQRGSMMLEALISILIFSIGILAIIGLQAASIKMSSDAKYRSDASFLASQLVAQMWDSVAIATPSDGFQCLAKLPRNQSDAYTGFELNPYLGNYNGLASTGGANFASWASAVATTLPNASASAVVTAITISPTPCSPNLQQSFSTNALITISWQLPGADPHIFSTNAQISTQRSF